MNSPDDKTQHGLRLPPSPGLQARNENASAAHTKRTPDLSLEELLLREPEPVAQNDSVLAASVDQADSLEHYADLFEFAPIAYLTLSGQGTITAVNLAAAEALGEARQTLMGSNFVRFVAADYVVRWHLHLACVIKQDQKQECELMLARKDGAVSYVRVNSNRSLKDGQVPTVKLILTDITKLKTVELEMEKAHQLAHIGSWHWDVNTGEQVMSSEMSKIFGRECIPPFPDQRGDVYTIETWEYLNIAVQAAVQGGIGYDLELPALRGDGTLIWINTTAVQNSQN